MPRENARKPMGIARLAPCTDGVTGPAAHGSDQRQWWRFGQLAAGGLPRAVARGHMRDLVRHHARQFGFAIRLQNQAGIHEEEAAGQRESVHFLGIEHLDGERNLGVGVAHQVLADAVDVFGDDRVVDDLRLPLDFLRQLLAEAISFSSE